MEPFEFDQIIKSKLSQGSELHDQEMQAAKPFVWSAIQSNKKRGSLTWIHLAAASVVLTLLFSFVLYEVQNAHTSEMASMADQIGQLQKNYHSQEAMLSSKNAQVEILEMDLNDMEHQLTSLQERNKENQNQDKMYVYRTDTVYLKQVEYITTVSNPPDPEPEVEQLQEPDKTDLVDAALLETDAAIYPSYSYKNTTSTETIKLKFGSFREKKN